MSRPSAGPSSFRQRLIATRSRLVAAALVAALVPALGPLALPDARAEGEVTIGESELVVETDRGVFPFAVEIADEPMERSKGLMYRRTMDPDTGMLFDMDRNEPATFWMKDTYVSLDIIFIREDGTVDSIAEATQPLSTAIVPSDGPVRFVLELVAGTARRIGLSEGDRVKHPVIDRWAGR